MWFFYHSLNSHIPKSSIAFGIFFRLKQYVIQLLRNGEEVCMMEKPLSQKGVGMGMRRIFIW